MRASILTIAASCISSTTACLYFNATISGGNSLTVHSWDDANNSNRTEPQDIICSGTNLKQKKDSTAASPYWSVPCSEADNAKSDTVFDVFLEPTTKRFLDVIYRYSNPDPGTTNLQVGEDKDEFYFNFRVGSVDGKFFKSREFCVQYDLLRLVKPESLKNPCDSLDSC